MKTSCGECILQQVGVRRAVVVALTATLASMAPSVYTAVRPYLHVAEVAAANQTPRHVLKAIQSHFVCIATLPPFAENHLLSSCGRFRARCRASFERERIAGRRFEDEVRSRRRGFQYDGLLRQAPPGLCWVLCATRTVMRFSFFTIICYKYL